MQRRCLTFPKALSLARILHYSGWTFPAFNVADSAISVGAALLILDELLRVRRGR